MALFDESMKAAAMYSNVCMYPRKVCSSVNSQHVGGPDACACATECHGV